MSETTDTSKRIRNAESAARLSRALAGDEDAVSRLVDEMLPVVQARVARSLLRNRRLARGRDVHQEVDDLTQEVFAALFAGGGRALRAWDATRGLSFPNFVGLLTEHEVSEILHSKRKSPWTEEPTAEEELDEASGSDDQFLRKIAARHLLGALFGAATEELSPKGVVLLRLLYMEQRPVGEVAAETGLSRDALYAWRSRLGRLLERLRGRLSGSPQERGL